MKLILPAQYRSRDRAKQPEEVIMPARSYAWPLGHWDWYQHLAFKHGVRASAMAFVGGQVDKSPAGEPFHVFDLATQTAVVIRHIDTVLREFGAGLANVVKLVAFYKYLGKSNLVF
jgi:enamine deaminase RidA (YjgF/YER057c/UK114 family)